MTDTAAADALENLGQRIKQAQARLTVAREKLPSTSPKELRDLDDDGQVVIEKAITRRLFSRLVLWTYCGAAVAILGSMLFYSIDEEGKRTAMAADFFKTAIVPIVTFILGFYYAQK